MSTSLSSNIEHASPVDPAQPSNLMSVDGMSLCNCFDGENARGRKLVVCIDGTANQFSAKNTNVIELYNRLRKREDQLTFYTSGIGTFARPSWTSPSYIKQVLTNIIDLAFAWRFERIVISAYRWLSENYKTGDMIFLFGFSRGAYQARVLSAMIDKVGLLYKGNEDQIPFAYQLYADSARAERQDQACVENSASTANHSLNGQGQQDSRIDDESSGGDSDEEIEPTSAEVLARFKRAFCHPNSPVHFVGSWDTVSSVGIIYDKTLPGTTDGMKHVCYFRHALALHERRVKFLPEYAYGALGPEGPSGQSDRANETSTVDEKVPLGTKSRWTQVNPARVRQLLSNIDLFAHSVFGLSSTLALHAANVVPRFRNEYHLWPLVVVCIFLSVFSAAISMLVGKVRAVRGRRSTSPTIGTPTAKPKRFSQAATIAGQVIYTVENRAQKSTAVATREAAPHTKEVWFSGCHSDIGGGAHANLRLSRFGPPLRWMAFEAMVAGLEFEPAPPTWVENPRPSNSMTWLWSILEWIPLRHLSYKASPATYFRPHWAATRVIQPGQLIHSTALDRPGTSFSKTARSLTDGRAECAADYELLVEDERVLPWIESDPYKELPRIISSISKSGGHVDFQQLKREDLEALRSAISTDPGREAFRDINKKSLTGNPLALLRDLFNTAISITGTQSDSSGIAAELVQASPHILRTLTLCNGDLDLCRRPAAFMEHLVRRLQLKEGKALFVKHLRFRPCALPIQPLADAQLGGFLWISYMPARRHQIATLSMWHGLVIWDLRTSRLLKTFARDPEDVERTIPFVCVTVSEDGKRIILGTRRGRLMEWIFEADTWRQGLSLNVGDPRSPETRHDPPLWLTCLLTLRGRSAVVSGWDDGTIAIHDPQTLDIRHCHRAHDNRISRLSSSPTSTYILSASWDGKVKIWDVSGSSPKCILTYAGHTKDVNHAVFSHDGKLIASGSDDRTVQVWAADDGSLRSTLVGHEGPVRSVRFSPRRDRPQVVSCASDDTIRVWDHGPGKEIAMYTAPTPLEGGLRAVVFNWDGDEFASLSLDGTVRRWDEWTPDSVGRSDLS